MNETRFPPPRGKLKLFPKWVIKLTRLDKKVCLFQLGIQVLLSGFVAWSELGAREANAKDYLTCGSMSNKFHDRVNFKNGVLYFLSSSFRRKVERSTRHDTKPNFT